MFFSDPIYIYTHLAWATLIEILQQTTCDTFNINHAFSPSLVLNSLKSLSTPFWRHLKQLSSTLHPQINLSLFLFPQCVSIGSAGTCWAAANKNPWILELDSILKTFFLFCDVINVSLGRKKDVFFCLYTSCWIQFQTHVKAAKLSICKANTTIKCLGEQ